MAKRTRGSRSAHRPGGLGPSHRGARSGATTFVPSTPGEEPRPSVEVAASSAPTARSSQPGQPAPMTPAQPIGQPVSRSTRGRPKVKADSLLAARSASEYRYVGEDLRRIGVVAGSLFGILLLIWLLLVPLNVAGLY